jgi:hypothetical protein
MRHLFVQDVRRQATGQVLDFCQRINLVKQWLFCLRHPVGKEISRPKQTKYWIHGIILICPSDFGFIVYIFAAARLFDSHSASKETYREGGKMSRAGTCESFHTRVNGHGDFACHGFHFFLVQIMLGLGFG